MIINVCVVVACVNAGGESDLVPMIVRCTKEQFDAGDHTEVAIAECEEESYYQPMIAFDRTDSHRGILDLFDWGTKEILLLDIAVGVKE